MGLWGDGRRCRKTATINVKMYAELCELKSVASRLLTICDIIHVRYSYIGTLYIYITVWFSHIVQQNTKPIRYIPSNIFCDGVPIIYVPSIHIHINTHSTRIQFSPSSSSSGSTWWSNKFRIISLHLSIYPNVEYKRTFTIGWMWGEEVVFSGLCALYLLDTCRRATSDGLQLSFVVCNHPLMCAHTFR